MLPVAVANLVLADGEVHIVEPCQATSRVIVDLAGVVLRPAEQLLVHIRPNDSDRTVGSLTVTIVDHADE